MAEYLAENWQVNETDNYNDCAGSVQNSTESTGKTNTSCIITIMPNKTAAQRDTMYF